MANWLLVTFFALFIAFLIMNIGAWFSIKFLNILPLPPNNAHAYDPLISVYNTIFGIWDNSFIFIVIFIIAIDWIVSYFKPQLAQGFLNILGLFVIVFIFGTLTPQITSVNNALSSNVLLPKTYAFMSSNYYLYVFLFGFALSAILNFRTRGN